MELRGFAPGAGRHFHTQLISIRSLESIGGHLKPMSSGATTGAYPAANLAIYVPVWFSDPFTIEEVFWENGTGASAGNVDVGLYDAAGTRLTSLGATARGAASVTITTTTFTAYTVTQPGLYYMAFSHSATNNIFACQPAAGLCEAMGVCEQATAHPLPATATMTRTARAYIPDFGFITTATALPA